jgi:hypothetical protein
VCDYIEMKKEERREHERDIFECLARGRDRRR